MEKDVRGLLKRVSRSMYLSLAVLPEQVRDSIGLGYLFCRAADTIADTRLVARERRLATLESFRSAFDTGAPVAAELAGGFLFHQASPAERELLTRLGDCIDLWREFPAEERALLRDVVSGVVEGMRMDLRVFTADTIIGLKAFKDGGELERYCAHIGGAPGTFWTDLCLLRIPKLRGADAGRLRAWGLRLGQGLQITNILRDIPKDLRNGRCYLPEAELAREGLDPRDLLDPASLPRLRPVLVRWLRWGLENLEAGASYVEAMPGLRLKAAVAWPLLLALKTLIQVGRSPGLLKVADRVKVSRGQVYGLVAGSPWTLTSNARFRRRFESLRGELTELAAK